MSTDNLISKYMLPEYNIRKRNLTIILKILASTIPKESTRLSMIYYHIYHRTYEIRVKMILLEHVLVHIWDDNNDQIR